MELNLLNQKKKREKNIKLKTTETIVNNVKKIVKKYFFYNLSIFFIYLSIFFIYLSINFYNSYNLISDQILFYTHF